MNENLITHNDAIKKFIPALAKRIRSDFLDRNRDPEGFSLIKENAKFRDIHRGERCFIIGNGPSLLRQNLSLLREEYVFTCNRIVQSEIYQLVEPSFHFWSDSRLIRQPSGSPEEKRIVDIFRSIKTGGCDPQVFVDSAMRDFIEDHGLRNYLNINYILCSHHKAFSPSGYVDLCRPLPHLPTVIQSAILAAVYMGFSEIILLGCDCTGFVSLANAVARAEIYEEQYCYKMDSLDRGATANAFAGEAIADELQNYVDLFHTYTLIQEYCERCNVVLKNATEGGLLFDLPRCKLETFFQ